MGLLRCPQGVAILSKGTILVSDCTYGTGSLQFSYPRGLTINKGLVFVTASGNHRVQVLHPI